MIALLFRPRLARALWKFHKALDAACYIGRWTRHDYLHIAMQPDLLKRFEFDATAIGEAIRPDTWERVTNEYERGKQAYRDAAARGDMEEACRLWMIVKGGMPVDPAEVA
jgi:hypothetical protein